MRVLTVCPEFPPRIGGMQSNAIGIARHLADSGVDLLVLTRTCKELKVTWRAAAATDAETGLPTVRCLEIKRGMWSAALPILRHIESFRPDAVYFSNVGYASCAAILSVPAVSRTVGNDFTRPWVGPTREHLETVGRTLRKFGLTPLVRWAAHRRETGPFMKVAQLGLSVCRLYLANSRYTRSGLLARGVPPECIRVIPGGVDNVFFEDRPEARSRIRAELEIREDQPVFVTACRLVAKKGIDDALRALAQVRQQFREARFVILGDGLERPLLQGLSEELGLGDAVRFMGRKPIQEVPAYLLASDVFLMPSKPAPRFKSLDVETMGRSACEAAACALPVIGTQTGGLPEVVGDGKSGILVEPGDVKALAEAMKRLLAQPRLRRHMAQAAAGRARESFSWASVGQATLEALAAAIEARPRDGMEQAAHRFAALAGARPRNEGELVEVSEDHELPDMVTQDPSQFHCRVWLARPADHTLRARLKRFDVCPSLSVAIDPAIQLGLDHDEWLPPPVAARGFADRGVRKLARACLAARRCVRGNGQVVLHNPGFLAVLVHMLDFPWHKQHLVESRCASRP